MAKLSLTWMGPDEVLAVGSCSSADTPDGSPLGAKLLYLDLPPYMPDADARRRVSVQRCKPCANPHDHGDMPKYLPAGLTQCVLNNFSKNPPRATSLKTTFRLLFKTRRGEDHRTPIGSRSRWGHLGHFRDVRTGQVSLDRPGSGKWTPSFSATRCRAPGPALRISAAPNQHRQTNRLYRRMRIGAAQRELLGVTASDSWRPATAAFLALNGLAATAQRCFPLEPSFGTRATTVCGGLGRSTRARLWMGYI